MAADDITKLEKRLAELESKPGEGAAGKEKVETLNKLAFAFHRSDSEKMKTYADQALSLAGKLDFKEGIATSHLMIALARSMKSFYDKALVSSEAQFRGLAESAGDIIVSIDFEGTVLYVNPAVEDILGYKPEEVIGLKLTEFEESPAEIKKIYHGLLQAINEESHLSLFEIGLKDKNGRPLVLEISARKMSNFITAIARDVTERKRMQQQLLRASKLASVGTLAAGIAHQVNNPLAIMLSTSAVLRDLLESYPQAPDDLQEIAFKYLGILEKQVDRTQKVVSGLMGFIQTRRSDVRSSNVNRLLKEVTRLLFQPLSSPDIEVELVLAENLPDAMLDPIAVQQALVNLVQNALDAMAGKGRLVLKTEAAGSMINISVMDNGPGVPPDLQERIFEPLFSTKGAEKGAGLGLSLSVMLLESFGGRIRYEDGPGGGAVFIVEVPETGEEYNES